MNVWHWLLGGDVPADATLRSLGLSGSGLLPMWAVPLLVVPLAVGVFALYFTETVRLSLFRRIVLVAVRTLLIAFALFLLTRPLLVAEFEGEKPRDVVVLLDRSQSMSQRDRRVSPRDRLRIALAANTLPLTASIDDNTLTVPADTPTDPSRADVVRMILRHPELKLRESLATKGPLRTYTFGRGLNSTGDNLLDEYQPDEPRTALADAVAEVLTRNPGAPPAAVVVFTDGRDNASRAILEDVARDCRRVGAALHVVGVGSSDAGLLQIRDVAAPATLFPDDTAAIPVRFRSQGLKQGTVEIVLKLNGKEVARKEAPAGEGGDRVEMLTFTPSAADASDRASLTAHVRLKETDGFTDEMGRTVAVSDRKVRLLYAENVPRWEYKFLQMVLLRDRRVDARFVLLAGDERAVNSGAPFLPQFPATRKELFAYDLLILGDVPAAALGAERLGWIADFVREGHGLIHIAGRQHAPASFVGTPLAEVLPVELAARRFPPDPDARTQPFQPTLTRAGERSPAMLLADRPEDNAKLWKELPGWYWHYPVTKLRPGATSLLAHPKQKAGDDPMPLVAMQYYGKGQVYFLASDETWRWRFNTRDSVFGRFWGQMIYQLGLPQTLGTRQAQISLERNENIVGQPGMVFARLFDSEYRPLTAERVTARLEQLDGPKGVEPQQVVLEAVPGQAGEYRAMLPHDRVGRFSLSLPGSQQASAEYRVELPPQHELAPGGLNEGPLREAAEASGGRFYLEEDLHRLPDSVEVKTASFTTRRETLLWGWPSFGLFLALIAVEWLVRKFSNLS